MKLLNLFIFILFASSMYAQCDKFPADCPQSGDIEAARDSAGCVTNLIVPQEIVMQNNLRNQITAMTEEAASKTNWQVYELTESSGRGIGIEGNTKPLPYTLRPPYEYTISFEFIVNNDSLLAWRNWLAEQNTAMERSVQSYGQVDNSSAKPFADSAMYYTNQMAKYITDHYSEYQKSLLSNDQKGIKKYEDGLKKYQDKIDYFVNRSNTRTAENFSSANNEYKNLEADTKRKKIAYRNASVVRVSFYFNNYTTRETDNAKVIKNITVPSSSLAVLFHNTQPDETNVLATYRQSSDYAFLLFGKWITKLNQYNAYDAAFRFDKKENDIISLKKIPSDKVQTIQVIVEGSPANINSFSKLFNWQGLDTIIVKE